MVNQVQLLLLVLYLQLEGNLKEPVTESTRKAARCFYGLNQGRADSKRYPAIDPIDSYSKYLEYPEVQEYLKENIGENWLDNVFNTKTLLLRGKEAQEQINILGDDGGAFRVS